MKRQLLRMLGFTVLKIVLPVYLATLRLREINDDFVKGLQHEQKSFILAFWHGSMFYGWYRFRKSGSTAITSKSKDGDVLASLLDTWKFTVVRGSSSQGGKDALEAMTNEALKGKPVLITPDGPRGPRHQFKAGGVVAAKRAEVPLVCAGIWYENKWELHNWDRFEIPKPFSKVRIYYSEPIRVPVEASREETGVFIETAQMALQRAQKLAEQPV